MLSIVSLQHSPTHGLLRLIFRTVMQLMIITTYVTTCQVLKTRWELTVGNVVSLHSSLLCRRSIATWPKSTGVGMATRRKLILSSAASWRLSSSITLLSYLVRVLRWIGFFLTLLTSINSKQPRIRRWNIAIVSGYKPPHTVTKLFAVRPQHVRGGSEPFVLVRRGYGCVLHAMGTIYSTLEVAVTNCYICDIIMFGQK